MIINALSWNIHKCVGNDRKRCATRILTLIKTLSPDIAILQEVDRKIGQNRSTLPIDEIEALSGLKAVSDLHSTNNSIGWRGNLLLTKPDIQCTRQINIPLPSIEPRGAVLWELVRDNIEFDVIGVHLGLLGLTRRLQAAAVASTIASRPIKPIIVAGDTNDWWFKSMEMSVIENLLGHEPKNLKTFPSRKPILSLDRTLAGRGAIIKKQEVIKNITASDHLPLMTTIKIDVEAS